MAVPQIDFRPFLNLSATYGTGLAGVRVTDQGTLADSSSAGIMLGWGISGLHSWRHTKVGLDYGGNVTHYTQRTSYDSINQSLLLGVTHDFSPHITLTLRESASIYSRNSGLQGLQQTVPFDPSTTYIPVTDFFDNRTEYASSQADVTILRSPRLSFDLGGDAAITRRRSQALYGVNILGARADTEYRLTRRVTVGALYRYTKFTYTRFFGATDLHQAGPSFGVALTQHLELSGFGGAMRVENKFIEQVPLDPSIAAILGISSAAQVAHSVRYVPFFSARLSRVFRSAVAYIEAGHTITSGNGLFTTSEVTSAMAGYTYSGVRLWSFQTIGGYTSSNALSLKNGGYSGFSGLVSATRNIHRSFHAMLSYGVRNYSSGDFANYNRTIQTVIVGVGWAPGDIPLRVW